MVARSPWGFHGRRAELDQLEGFLRRNPSVEEQTAS